VLELRGTGNTIARKKNHTSSDLYRQTIGIQRSFELTEKRRVQLIQTTYRNRDTNAELLLHPECISEKIQEYKKNKYCIPPELNEIELNSTE